MLNVNELIDEYNALHPEDPILYLSEPQNADTLRAVIDAGEPLSSGEAELIGAIMDSEVPENATV